MEKWKTVPFVLQRRILFTLLSGIGGVVISTVIYVISADRILLGLSGCILVGCLFRCKALWEIIAHNKYETLTGTCISVTTPALRKYRRVKLMDHEGEELTVLVNKQAKIRIGARYRFYFQKDFQPVFGNEYLDASLSSNHFLGYEALEDSEGGPI